MQLHVQAEQRQCHEMSAYREGGGAKSRKRGTSSGWQVGQVSASVTDRIVFQTPFQRTLRLEEQVLSSKMLSQHAGTVCEALWPYMNLV